MQRTCSLRRSATGSGRAGAGQSAIRGKERRDSSGRGAACCRYRREGCTPLRAPVGKRHLDIGKVGSDARRIDRDPAVKDLEPLARQRREQFVEVAQACARLLMIA